MNTLQEEVLTHCLNTSSGVVLTRLNTWPKWLLTQAFEQRINVGRGALILHAPVREGLTGPSRGMGMQGRGHHMPWRPSWLPSLLMQS